MARQEIILGTAPTGLGGDPPRTASTKINAMTAELYGITPLTRGGTGSDTASGARINLGVKSAGMLEILGETTQTGGVPTGAIFNSGSNASGFYTFMADGTLICSHRQYVSLSLSNRSGTWFYDLASWSFPVTFISAPKISVNSWTVGRLIITGRGGEPLSTTSSGAFFIMATEAVPESTFVHEWLAVGRWF